MRELTQCPSCGCQDLLQLKLRNDVSEEDMKRPGVVVTNTPGYSLCRRCELIFIRSRQTPEEIAAIYSDYKELAKRDYAVYPLPQKFLDAQDQFADRIFEALSPDCLPGADDRVLNIRSECGAILAKLRDECGTKNLYALDHFDPNRRHASENLGIPHVAKLDMLGFEHPFEEKTFDLVLANHAVTHSHEPLEVLAKLEKMLTPNGKLVLYGENDYTVNFGETWFHEKGPGGYHMQLFCEQSLANLCRIAGFEPKLLAYHAEGIPWAASHHILMLQLERREPVAPEDIVPRDPIPILQAYHRGRAKFEKNVRRDQRLSALRRVKDRAFGVLGLGPG